MELGKFKAWYFTFVQSSWILLTYSGKGGVVGLHDEYQLLKDMLVDYDPAVRPVKNHSDVVQVQMGVALFQIRDLDEKNQFLQVNAWFQFHWADPHLVWNVSSYPGLIRVHIPSSRIWVPDVVLYNSVDETKPATQIFPETNAIVSSDGEVLWVIPAMTKSSCKIDVTYFPFDEQRCPLKFGSWTYDGFQLDLRNLKETGDLTKYTVSGEWDLVGMPAARNVDIYSCCEEPYVDVTYTIILRRKPMFFTYNLVFPCVLLMGIGVLVFCLPPESGEKVSLGVTVLLAMTVYQLLIAETIPATSEVVPLIGQFFGATIFLLSMSSAMTVIIMKLHFSGEHGHQVPPWMRRLVIVWLARIVRLDTAPPQPTYPDKDYYGPVGRCGVDGRISLLNHGATTASESNCTNNSLLQQNQLSHSHSYDSSHSPRRFRHHSSSSNSEQRRILLQQIDVIDRPDVYGVLWELLTNVRQINEELHQNYRNTEVDNSYKSEWRKVALVLDRLLLFTFFTVTCVTCGAIFINVPH